MDRYIGLDVHATSTTMVVVGPTGKLLTSQVVETSASVLIAALKLIPGVRHVCLEEGTQAEWLHEMLKPHVEELVVVGVPERRGQKSDAHDALALAEMLRTNSIKTRVFKSPGAFASLREFSRVYTMLTRDVSRTKNRIKSFYRSRGIPTKGTTVYAPSSRAEWLTLLPSEKQAAIGPLYAALDCLVDLKKQVSKKLVGEAQRHPCARKLESCPGFGPVRAAQLMAIVVTPDRFRTRKQFWAYCGLGIVMRSSADWVRGDNDQWRRSMVAKTRGLNLNHNHQAKNIMKDAATTVVRSYQDSALGAAYFRAVNSGTKPDRAKLTLARRIAATVLALWKSGEEYDETKQRREDSRLAS